MRPAILFAALILIASPFALRRGAASPTGAGGSTS